MARINISFNRRRGRRVITAVGILLTLIAMLVVLNWEAVSSTAGWLVVYGRQPAATPLPATTRDGRWQQDVQYLAAQLPALHIKAFFKTSQGAFEANAAKLVADIPKLNDQQIAVEIMRLVASIGDSHTQAGVQKALAFRSYPIGAAWLEDGLYVLAATEAYQQAIGARLIKVENNEVMAVVDAVKPLFAWDNESQVKNFAAQYVTTPEILYGLGIVPTMEKARFTFQPASGDPFTLELAPLPLNQRAKVISAYEKFKVTAPLSVPNRNDYYWFEYLPAQKAMYFHYRVCAEMKERPFSTFMKEMFAAVDQSGAERMILDLRYNGGGNEAVLWPFIEEMKRRPTLNAKGKFFVLIGRRTFSSALGNAITLKTQTNTTLVGEMTGGKPNHYGEIKSFVLPNSRIEIWYSTRYWLTIRDSDPVGLSPDITIPPTIQEYLTGRDLALEAALK